LNYGFFALCHFTPWLICPLFFLLLALSPPGFSAPWLIRLVFGEQALGETAKGRKARHHKIVIIFSIQVMSLKRHYEAGSMASIIIWSSLSLEYMIG